MARRRIVLLRVALPAVLLLLAALWWWHNPAVAPIGTLAQHVTTGDETLALSRRIIATGDLPPPGTRSLFDHLMAQNDGLPYPFDKLIALLEKQHPDGQAPITLLIPQGRSLLKGQADNAHPRIVVAADFEGRNTPAGFGIAPRGQLFFALVEKANEIEVISYNEAAGRFEFQLVQNYCAGCVPRIVYTRRAICLTCHQGSAPIFSERLWNETNAQPEVTQAIAAARGSDAPYMGVTLAQGLSQPERFEQLTDVGNFRLVTQRLWLDGCGPDGGAGTACRRLLLSLALRYLDNAGGFNPDSADAVRLRALQAASFPPGGIAVPDSHLRNRDPIGERRGVLGALRALFSREIRLGEGARDNEDLAAFDTLPPLRPELDPLTVRAPRRTLQAGDIDGVYGLASFFTNADLVTLKAASGNDMNALLARVAALPDAQFAATPFVRVRLLDALLGSPRSYCCLATEEMSPPVVSGVPPLVIREHPELQPFAEHCFACHRGNPAKRLDFMSGDSEAAVLENIKGKKEIRDALDWERYEASDKKSKLMPPRDSVQYHKLVAAGSAGVAERKQMRELVPGLFQF